MMATTTRTTPTPDELRDDFAARLRDEGLQNNFRLDSLTRWVASVPDERVGEAIELIEIGLDATRPGREETFRIIEYELRTPHRNLPHWACVRFLRWIVRSRPTTAKVNSKLKEIRAAGSLQKRDKLLQGLDGAADPKSLKNAHSIFAHAWRAAPPDARPSGEIHCGEAEPFIGAMGTIRAALFIARRVEHLVASKKKNAAAFARFLSLAEVAANEGGPPSQKLLDALNEPTPTRTGGSAEDVLIAGVISIARGACAEARAVLRKPDAAGSATRPAAVKAVGFLLEADGSEAVRSFLADLDDELRRLDVVHALGSRDKKPSRPIARAIFRGADSKGKIHVWLAALEKQTPAKKSEPETYGLLAKDGRFWAWTEGGKDEVLATVPDKFFERAALAAK